MNKVAIDRMIATQRIPHALLFHGPQGVGKSHCATSLAEACATPLDIRHYHPDGKGNVHTIETIRSLITEATRPPKWLIIHDAHRMLPPSANALLKTLEEPEPGVHLILITHEPDCLLPTIRSRLSSVPFFEPTDVLHRGSSDIAFQLISGESPNLEDIDIDDLLTAIFYWYRDMHLLHAGGDPELLFFRDHQDELHTALKRPIPPLERVQKAIAKVREATQLHVRLDRALETFFLTL